MNRRVFPARPAARIAAAAACVAVFAAATAFSQEVRPAEEARAPVARFITVLSPVEDGKILNAALKLQQQAEQEDREAILVLQIVRGSEKFGVIRDLADDLTSARFSRVRTVAWVPETVTGNKVILALACKEIVMHPDAKLGDIGVGKSVEPDQKAFVLELVAKRHNPKLSHALVLGMLDPEVKVFKLTIETAEKETETRIVTEDEYQKYRDNKVVIQHVETLKDQGLVGTYSGRQARVEGFLVAQTAETRGDVADLYHVRHDALRDDPTSEGVKAAVIKLEGMIEPVMESFITRQIDRAVANGANLLIFRIDSPGGVLLSSENLAYAIAELDPQQVRTVAYIPRQALSGAAIISLGCDEIYMHPNAQIGDAGPIEMREGGQFHHADEKIVSHLRLTLAELAEKKDRPAALAMAMADRNLKVYEARNTQSGKLWYMTEEELHEAGDEWEKGRVVAETGQGLFLNLTGDQAHRFQIAEPPVEDEEAFIRGLDLPADFDLEAVAVEQTWIDTMIILLNTDGARFLLILMGVILIYLELHFMSGLLGILSVLCFSLFFWSHFLGGTAGWLEIVLFLLGLGCIAMEIFVIPGFGVFGVSGGLLVFASLVMACQTWGPYEQNADTQRMFHNMGVLTASVGSVVVLAVLMSRYLPHMPLLSKLILAPPGTVPGHSEDEPQLRPEIAAAQSSTAAIERDVNLIGKQGTAVSVLRPAGKARIEGNYVDVVSDGPFIQPGAQLEVISVRGNLVVVREVT